MKVGVEVGGTFTDLIAFHEHGTIVHVAKVFSTPADPANGVLTALDSLPGEIRQGASVLHGSTVATNAVIERNGPTLGFIATRGFGDILELQRQDRTDIYDLQYRKPVPLVPHRLVAEVVERLDAEGKAVTPLDEGSVVAAIDRLVQRGVTAVAVCLLHAYANPEHEQRIRKIVGCRHPQVLVSLSSEVVREFREYERASSTVVDAFVKPVIDRYLGHLESVLAELDLTDLWMMQSNGGLLPASYIRKRPVQTLFSGPAAGVTGALAIARSAGIENIITMDMGGTSTDVCLVADGQPEITTESTIDGLPVKLPMLDIVSVGAGGGSIAWVDSGGMLQVGPGSAGAAPGPACYGRGGERVTTTDANVARSLIRPDHFLGGRATLDPVASERVLGRLAEQLDQQAQQLAEDIFRISTSTMAAAIRLVSVERGRDPRDFALVAYGGAGPLYAANVADELNIGTVIVPPYPGLISAYGLLVGQVQHDFMRTQPGSLDSLSMDAVRSTFDSILQSALHEVEGYIDASKATVVYGLDMRYRGQGFELTVPLTSDDLTSDDASLLGSRFHHLHEQRYGHASSSKPVEVVTWRVSLVVPPEQLHGLRVPQEDWQEPEPMPVVIGGQETACLFFQRGSLPVGFTAAGPAVVEEETSTTFVPPGWMMRVDEQTHLVIEPIAPNERNT